MNDIHETQTSTSILTPFSTMTPVEFGQLVRLARKKRRWTQKQLGEALSEAEGSHLTGDVARVTISRIEAGSYRTEPERVQILAKLLDLATTERLSADQYAMLMSELTRTCMRLSPVQVQSVIDFARALEATK